MSKLKHVVFFLMILLSAPVMADSKSAALEVVQSWTDPLNRQDLDGAVKAFAPDASYLGTTTTTLVSSTDGIRKYFEGIAAKYSPFTVELGQLTVSELSPDSAVVTGFDRWKVTVGGRAAEWIGRLSIAVARRDGQWRIVSFHRSAMPN